MKIWLDDIRPSPSGWVRASSPEELIEFLQRSGVEEISLDYDLGLTYDRGIEWAGEDVLKWIEGRVAVGPARFAVPKIAIHSSNFVGRERM